MPDGHALWFIALPKSFELRPTLNETKFGDPARLFILWQETQRTPIWWVKKSNMFCSFVVRQTLEINKYLTF